MGAEYRSPPCSFAYARRAAASSTTTAWCLRIGDGVTNSSPSMISRRRLSSGKLRRSSYVRPVVLGCVAMVHLRPAEGVGPAYDNEPAGISWPEVSNADFADR